MSYRNWQDIKIQIKSGIAVLHFYVSHAAFHKLLTKWNKSIFIVKAFRRELCMQIPGFAIRRNVSEHGLQQSFADAAVAEIFKNGKAFKLIFMVCFTPAGGTGGPPVKVAQKMQIG